MTYFVDSCAGPPSENESESLDMVRKMFVVVWLIIAAKRKFHILLQAHTARMDAEHTLREKELAVQRFGHDRKGETSGKRSACHQG